MHTVLRTPVFAQGALLRSSRDIKAQGKPPGLLQAHRIDLCPQARIYTSFAFVRYHSRNEKSAVMLYYCCCTAAVLLLYTFGILHMCCFRVRFRLGRQTQQLQVLVSHSPRQSSSSRPPQIGVPTTYRRPSELRLTCLVFRVAILRLVSLLAGHVLLLFCTYVQTTPSQPWFFEQVEDGSGSGE